MSKFSKEDLEVPTDFSKVVVSQKIRLMQAEEELRTLLHLLGTLPEANNAVPGSKYSNERTIINSKIDDYMNKLSDSAFANDVNAIKELLSDLQIFLSTYYSLLGHNKW